MFISTSPYFHKNGDDLHISVLLLSNSHYDLSHHKDYLVIVTNPSNSVPCNALGYHVIIAVPLWTSL